METRNPKEPKQVSKYSHLLAYLLPISQKKRRRGRFSVEAAGQRGYSSKLAGEGRGGSAPPVCGVLAEKTL